MAINGFLKLKELLVGWEAKKERKHASGCLSHVAIPERNKSSWVGNRKPFPELRMSRSAFDRGLWDGCGKELPFCKASGADLLYALSGSSMCQSKKENEVHYT
ncbi:hypothetical protein VNO80_35195 [Phaseolus coccineus]|uniref:Uncharacterized protein n=1 Tax=Phaseolus coccineus TaxID=3886 RepID=A0AAN9Q4J6_PHACN